MYQLLDRSMMRFTEKARLVGRFEKLSEKCSASRALRKHSDITLEDLMNAAVGVTAVELVKLGSSQSDILS